MGSLVSASGRFLGELKRRRVLKVAAVYAVVGWLIVQVADIVAPNLGWPGWFVSAVIVLIGLGFVLALVLAWVFDLTPGGMRRTDPMPSEGTGPLDPAGATIPPGARTAPPQPGSRTVAVLPFANLSAEAENEYFADGITEDVIAHLAKIGDLSVTSRASVMLFKRDERSLREIGAALGAATLLAGSVRREGDRVRIVTQLVDAATDRYLWAETYDRRLTDVFAIQTDVALQIAAALDATLSPDEKTRIRKEPTKSLEAYQQYRMGQHWFVRYTEEAVRQAIDYFERAIALDPAYALAHAGVAMAYAELAETGAANPDQAYRSAMKAAAAAIALDGELAEAHCVVGQLKVVFEFDWEGAERAFRRALELSPSSADTHALYGRMCSALERFDEAVAMERRAQELDPLGHRSDLPTVLLRAGRFEEARELAQRAVAFDPTYARLRSTLGWAYLKSGQVAEGMAEMEEAVALSEGDTAWLSQLGQAYGVVGKIEQAQDVLDRLLHLARERYVSPYHLAYVYTGLGEAELAIDQLERAFEERGGALYGIKGSFLFATLHSHPRFEALLGRMNLA